MISKNSEINTVEYWTNLKFYPTDFAQKNKFCSSSYKNNKATEFPEIPDSDSPSSLQITQYKKLQNFWKIHR